MKVRLAYSRNLMLTFTPRGRQVSGYQRGFVRLNGKTVTGFAYQGLSDQWTFFAEGVHEQLAYQTGLANRAATRLAA